MEDPNVTANEEEVDQEEADFDPDAAEIDEDEFGEPEEDLETEEDEEESEEDTGASVWDEDESATLRQARKDAELTASADSVRAYLKQIGKVALLNAEQEVSLAERIEAGLYAQHRLDDMERLIAEGDAAAKLSPAQKRDLRWIARDGRKAKNHLLEANLRLVVSLAKRYTGRGMAFLDLIQEETLALFVLLKFTTPRATSSLPMQPGGFVRPLRAPWQTRHVPSVSLSTWLRSLTSLAASRGSFCRILAVSLPREVLAKEMDITEEKVLEIQQYAREPISLDQTIGDEGDSQLGDFIEDSEAVIAVDAVSFTLLQDQLRTF